MHSFEPHTTMLFLLVVMALHGSTVAWKEGYQWSEQANGRLPSQRLAGHIIEEKANMFTVLQCAMACTRHHQCQSYNYFPDQRLCEINDATKEEYIEDVEVDEEAVYYGKNAYTIDEVIPRTRR